MERSEAILYLLLTFNFNIKHWTFRTQKIELGVAINWRLEIEMFEITEEPFGPCQSQLSKEWRSVARSLLGEEQERNDEKISLLREAILARKDLVGLSDSQFVDDNGFLMRYLGWS